jgi:hypothetical protein
MPGLLPRHFGAAASLAIELLVAVHGNRYLQQLSAEFDGTSVRDPLAGGSIRTSRSTRTPSRCAPPGTLRSDFTISWLPPILRS